MVQNIMTLIDGKVVKVDVEMDNITAFAIVNVPIFKKNGDFKRFNRRGQIKLSTGEKYPCTMSVINECKSMFKYKLLDKDTVGYWKNVGGRFSTRRVERKAVNWDYQVIGNK